MFSNYNGMILEINSSKKFGNSQICGNSNIVQNNQQAKEVTREIRKYFEMNEQENTTYKNLWDLSKCLKRDL